MPATIKKKTSSKSQPAAKKAASIKMMVGDMHIDVEPVSATETAKANARIQKKVKPVFSQIKRTRSAAAITASKIILNA